MKMNKSIATKDMHHQPQEQISRTWYEVNTNSLY